MHAYLIIARNEKLAVEEINKIALFKKYKLIEFPVKKIDDARNLNAFIKLSMPEKTAVFIKNFQNATEECSNAILKNIEEPQNNLIFIIHARSENSILPTIKSRCQVIRINPTYDRSDSSEIQNFLKMDLIGKAEYLRKINKREEAVAFSEMMLEFFTEDITQQQKIKHFPRIVKSAIILNKALKYNGNVNLHLLRFMVDISN